MLCFVSKYVVRSWSFVRQNIHNIEARQLEIWLVFKGFHNTNFKEQNHGNLNQHIETSFISFLNKESNLRLMLLVQNKRNKQLNLL